MIIYAAVKRQAAKDAHCGVSCPQCCSSLPWHRRSRAALTYAEAQSRIDDERLQDELSVNLRRMNGVAKVLRRQRAERGALQLASPEVKFEIDTETHDPLDVGMYQVCITF